MSQRLSIIGFGALAGVLLSMLILGGCNPDSEVVDETEIFYYSCDGNLVIRAEQNTSENCLISIYRGKELVTGRQLLRKDTAGWNYVGGDIFAMITDSMINLEFKGDDYNACFVSASEKSRREYTDTLYYITNTGALLKLIPAADSIHLSMKYGPTEVFDGFIPRVQSGSGEKYQDGNTMFWSKGNTAMFVHQGINYSHCVRMWRDEVDANPCEDASLNEFATRFLNRTYTNGIDLIPEEQRTYYAERYDLNNDGDEEVIIAMRSPYFCGSGGCTWHIVASDTNAIATVSVSQFPVYVSHTTTDGYHDLHVYSGDTYHTLKYSEGKYPSNPSVEPEIRLFTDSRYTAAGAIRLLDNAYQKSCPF